MVLNLCDKSANQRIRERTRAAKNQNKEPSKELSEGPSKKPEEQKNSLQGGNTVINLCLESANVSTEPRQKGHFLSNNIKTTTLLQTFSNCTNKSFGNNFPHLALISFPGSGNT